jgi:hypothetical protein
MRGALKSIFLIFCTVFLAFAMPKVFSLYNETLSDELTTTYAGVSTGAGVYSANFTLPSSLYRNSLAYVSEISSNITSDSPSVFSYNTVSKLLVANGLEESQTRTLAVTFRIPSTTIDSFMANVLGLFLWLYVFIVIGCGAGSIYSFFTN